MKNPNQVYACVVNIYGTLDKKPISYVKSFHIAASSFADAQRQVNIVTRELYQELKLDPTNPALKTQSQLERMTAAELMTFGHIAAFGEDQEQRLHLLQVRSTVRH